MISHKTMTPNPESVAALVAFAEGEAFCPCCEGVRECLPECTMKEDCQNAGGSAMDRYKLMVRAREALQQWDEGQHRT